ncbi:MAG: L-threonine 3-dehydrogenase [Parachlamydiaceae bacterium]
MKAIVKKYKQSGLEIEDVPVPDIKDDEVLIKTIKTSICGTDLHIYEWDAWAQKVIHVPLVIGHEFMGKIAKVGRHVKNLKEGDRVSGEGHLTCGVCPLCREEKRHLCPNTLGLGVNRHGCFAEYFHFPATNVFPLPSNVSDDIAAILDPYGNAAHTALSFSLTGEDVLITGAGPIGIMAAAIAKKAGARIVMITDRNPYRLALAKKMGATHTVNIESQSLQEAMLEAGVQYGFTVGLEMSGNEKALVSLLEAAQHGAHLALLGIFPEKCAINMDLVIFKMLTIKGIYGREIFKTWYQTTHLLESGLDLSPIITHQFAADDYEQGFAAMRAGNCGKVILNW